MLFCFPLNYFQNTKAKDILELVLYSLLLINFVYVFFFLPCAYNVVQTLKRRRAFTFKTKHFLFNKYKSFILKLVAILLQNYLKILSDNSM